MINKYRLVLLLPAFMLFNVKTTHAITNQAENDTLNKQYFDSLSYQLYPSPGGGFASGNNAYGDKAKAQEFRAGNLCNIYGVMLHFGHVQFQSFSDSSYLYVNFYDLSGTGRNTLTSSAKCPGNIFHKDSILLADIDTVNGNMLSYTNPLFTDSNFAIGIDLFSLNDSVDIALYTNKDGDAGSREQSWEKDANNNWYSLKFNWPLNVDFAVFPIVNTSVGINILSSSSEAVSLQPNPTANGEVLINVPLSALDAYQVYNSNLQLVHATCSAVSNNQSKLDIAAATAGIYFLKMRINHSIIVKKIVVSGK
jgi:hypothetical protein